MDKKLRFYGYGLLEFLPMEEYINSSEWDYEGTEETYVNGHRTEFDIVRNMYTGEFRYTFLDYYLYVKGEENDVQD